MNSEEYVGRIRELAAGVALDRRQRGALQAWTGEDPATAAVSALGVDVAARFDERVEFFWRTITFCPERGLLVDGRQVRARVGPVELWRFYVPLCQLLAALARGAGGVRVLAGVTGPPGSGKSVFSALLAEIINACTRREGIEAAVCPLDGFHYPNAHLDGHFVTDERGRRRPLRWRKGAPDTFDVAAFVAALDRLRAEPSVKLPRYDRRIHDPVPDAVAIGPRHRVVLPEGNYLLLPEPPWEAVAPRLDVSVFLTLPLDDVKPWIIQRHMRGGRSGEDAARHFEEVDKKNYETCMASAERADLIVERGAAQRIVAMTRAGRTNKAQPWRK